MKTNTLERFETIDDFVDYLEDISNRIFRAGPKERQRLGRQMTKDIKEYRETHDLAPSTDKRLEEVQKTYERYSNATVTGVQKAQNSACRHNKRSIWDAYDDFPEWDNPKGESVIKVKMNKVIDKYPLIAKQLLTWIMGQYRSKKGELSKNADIHERAINLPLADFLDKVPLMDAEGDLSETQIKDKRKNGMRKIRQAMELLFATSAAITYKRDNKSVTDYVDLFDSDIKRIQTDLAEKYTLDLDNGKLSSTAVIFAFTPKFAYYVTKDSNQKIFHNVLYTIQPDNNSIIPDVAWAMGTAMDEHYYTFANWPDPVPGSRYHKKKATHSRLAVKTLLTGSPLPTKKQAKVNPGRTIIEPFFGALDLLCDIGFLDHYKIIQKSKDEETEIDPAVYYAFTYDELSACYLDFQIHNPKDISEDVKRYWDNRLHRKKGA